MCIRDRLWLASNDEEMQEVSRKNSVYCDHGIPSDVLNAQVVASTEPALRTGLAGALLVNQDAVVSPQIAARFLLQQALARRLTLFPETATALGSGRAFLSSGDELRAPILVNACLLYTSRCV